MSGLAASRYGNAAPSLTSASADPTSRTSYQDHTSHDDVTYYDTSTAIHDLGRERFDQDVAAVGDRDTALNRYNSQPVKVAKGRAPRGKEAAVFAWTTMQYTTADKDAKEEAKGDLHGGQLHRQNRAAREPEFGNDPILSHGGHRGGGGGGACFKCGELGHNKADCPQGGRPGRRGRNERGFKVQEEGFLRAAMKPEHPAPPLCKGFAEELSADLFWSEPIV